MTAGRVRRVNGPVLEVVGLRTGMLDLVEVGGRKLPGEVIALDPEAATVQVYAYTGGIRPGDEVVTTGQPLMAELGPGLLGGVYDGMLRRLSGAEQMLGSDQRAATLDQGRRWLFRPELGTGQQVEPGDVLGFVQESAAITFRALVPHGVSGAVEWIASEAEFNVSEPIARVSGVPIALAHHWPVRRPRPARERLRADAPLFTGQRAIDLFFPIARGGSASVPGGFGTGKTVLLQQIAKWCDADVIVYVGCGERGNEMADVLEEMAALEDPRTGRSLLDRTVLIANTSNMPVLAREASIYTGVTVAEFYRDMGYDAVLIADSTSRWAEALREVRLAHRRASGGGGVSGRPRLGTGCLLRACRPCSSPGGRGRIGDDPRCRLAARRRHHRAGQRAHAALRPVHLVARHAISRTRATILL